MKTLVADLRHLTACWDATSTGVLLRAAPRLLLYPRMRAVVLFRMAAWCWRHRLKLVALWFQACSIRSAGAEIHPGATIGPGLSLIHSVGIVVGHEVVAGQNLVLYHGVTLGHGGRGPGQPRLGDRVRVGTGATVIGPVTIGNDVQIGANSLVLADVPAGATVVGVWKGAQARSHD